MKRKIFLFAPVFIASLIVICSITPTVAMSESISDKVFRLHILANSDSKEDQELKLKVRDALLELSEGLFEDCNSVDDAIDISNANKNVLKREAEKIIKSYGYDYNVKIEICKQYFNTRDYGDFTLPAGIYNSLRVIIGKGNGHNWWCVMFPSVCLSGCTDDFDGVLTQEEKNLITNKKYIIKFKSVELYEKIKSKIIS